MPNCLNVCNAMERLDTVLHQESAC